MNPREQRFAYLGQQLGYLTPYESQALEARGLTIETYLRQQRSGAFAHFRFLFLKFCLLQLAIQHGQLRRDQGNQLLQALVNALKQGQGTPALTFVGSGQGKISVAFAHKTAADLLSQIAVSLCLAEGYRSTGLQDLVCEQARSVEAYGGIGAEIDRPALIVGDDPVLQVLLEVFVQSEVIAGGLETAEQSLFGLLVLRNRQERPADGLVGAGQAEIAPFGSEDSVVQHGYSFCSRVQIFFLLYEIR